MKSHTGLKEHFYKQHFKLKEFHIILCNIAEYPETIPRQYQQSYYQQLKRTTRLSHNKELERLSNRIVVPKQKAQILSVKKRKTAEKSLLLKNVFAWRKKETPPTSLHINRIESTDDESLEIIPRRKYRHKRGYIFDSDESSNASSSQVSPVIKDSPLKKAASPSTKVSQHNRPVTVRSDKNRDSRQQTSKGTSVTSFKVGSDSENSLDKENLTFIDYNSNTEKVFSDVKSFSSAQSNCSLTLDHFTNEVHKVKEKCSPRKDSLAIIDVENGYSTDKSFEDNTKKDEIDENLYSNISLHTSEKQVNKKDIKQDQRDPRINLSNNSAILSIDSKLLTEQTLPKITTDTLLPKGTIKFVRSNGAYSNIRESDQNKSLNQNYNNNNNNNNNINKSVNRIDIDVSSPEYTDIFKEKKNYITNNNIIINDSIESANSTAYYQNQNGKRTSEEHSENVDAYTKRIKLKKDYHQKDVEYSNYVDLRDILRLKRSKKISISETGSDKNIDSKRVTEINEKNNINVTNAKNGRTRDKFSQDQGSTSESDEDENQNNLQHSSPCSTVILPEKSVNVLKETYSQISINTCENSSMENKCTNDLNDTNSDYNDEEDDDCISIFATETFDISQGEEDMFSNEHKVPDEKQSTKVLNSDSDPDPVYYLSSNSLDKYIKQNENEFNREYEKCRNMKVQESKGTKFSKPEVIKNGLTTTSNNNKASILPIMKQTLPKMPKIPSLLTLNTQVYNEQVEKTQHYPLTCSTNLISSTVETTQFLTYREVQFYFNGYCFNILKSSTCNRYLCPFNHDFQDFLRKFHAIQDPNILIRMIKFTKCKNFYFCGNEIYKTSLTKFDIAQILMLYKMFYNIEQVNVTFDVIQELLSRTMPLKTIVDHIVISVSSLTQLPIINNEIFKYVEKFIEPGKYWYIVKRVLPILTPSIQCIYIILKECVSNRNLRDIQDINNMLICKLSPTVILQLDQHLLESFKYLYKNSAKDVCNIKSVQNFGENHAGISTIASPDTKQNLSRSQSPEMCNIAIPRTSETNKILRSPEKQGTSTSDRPYILRPIDDLPEPQSAHRNHDNLWKFFVDLDRLKKGLEHKDYDYVIDILEIYSNENESYFVHSCCNILRTEIKRSEYHLSNIIQRTVQSGTLAVLRKILYDIGVNILTALMDVEAWRLAYNFAQTLKICDSPSSAQFIMLLAEIYIANNEPLEAFELFTNKNLISTSRTKWRVISTVEDECVRNKLIYILLDALCNCSVEHAFFLFTFLLRDQSSQFYPIDLSRYVDKLIIIFLSKDDASLITEMGNLVLKYYFPLSIKVCRALITTSIHLDEKLAMQLYCYAEGAGLYSFMELWPVTHIIMNNDLTEEEIYLVILQLLEKLKINLGPSIERTNSQRIAVYIIFEVKSTLQFYCASQQIHYNRQAIENIKVLVRSVLRKRFDPPLFLKAHAKEKICRLQNKSLINYLRSEHCN